MSEILDFGSKEEAYDFLKENLFEGEFSEFKNIAYGLQVNVSIGPNKGIVRIFESNKKIVKIDFSATKNLIIEGKIRQVFKIFNGTKILPLNETKNIHGKVHSICIGVNHFKEYSQLNFAKEDSEELNNCFMANLKKGNHVLLTELEVTPKRILTEIEKVDRIIKEEDIFLLFFASHGQFVEVNNIADFFLICNKSEIKNPLTSAVSMNKLKKIVSALPCKKKVILLDTCYSGGICMRDNKKEISLRTKEEIFRSDIPEDLIIISSCGADEKSIEDKRMGHGVFTYYLLSGLTGAVESKEGLLDFSTLYAYVHQKVSTYAEKNGNEQHPRYFGNLTEPFFFPLFSYGLKNKSLEPLDNQNVEMSFETINCVGIDESGKGDYFGPLVVAAVYVDTPRKVELLKHIGIKDSKKLKDSKIKELAKRIMKICDSEIIQITNPTYNQLRSTMGNLNELLAWAHAKSLEEVLKRNPQCKIAISDQFTYKEALIDKLKEHGKNIQVIQRPKAEENIAVAAASILARNKFLLELEILSKNTGLILPKGADEKVNEVGRKIVASGKSLGTLAKLHFSNTEKINKA